MSETKKLKLSHPWISHHNFVVTTTLHEKLRTISLLDQWKYAYVQSFILQELEIYDKIWVDVSSHIWKSRFGTKYHKITAGLEALGELELKKNAIWTKNKTGKTFSYRIPMQARDSGITNLSIPKQRVRQMEDTSRAVDPVSQHALTSLRSLGLRGDLIFPPPEDPDKHPALRKALIINHCEHMLLGDYALHYGGTVKRLFHRVLAMPREGRHNLICDSPLVEYDVKSCHPFLLLKFFSDKKEQEKYHEMLQQDIYKMIANEMGLADRQSAKEDLQKVVNSRYKEASLMASQPVFEFFHSHLPKFAEEILFLRRDLAPTLQSFEAKLMVKELGQECLRRGMLWVPMHDGFICEEHQGEEIESMAMAIFEKHIGFVPRLESSPLR